jgi:hypothetical protein
MPSLHPGEGGVFSGRGCSFLSIPETRSCRSGRLHNSLAQQNVSHSKIIGGKVDFKDIHRHTLTPPTKKGYSDKRNR